MLLLIYYRYFIKVLFKQFYCIVPPVCFSSIFFVTNWTKLTKVINTVAKITGAPTPTLAELKKTHYTIVISTEQDSTHPLNEHQGAGTGLWGASANISTAEHAECDYNCCLSLLLCKCVCFVFLSNPCSAVKRNFPFGDNKVKVKSASTREQKKKNGNITHTWWLELSQNAKREFWLASAGRKVILRTPPTN